jgi:hypothetical protein
LKNASKSAKSLNAFGFKGVRYFVAFHANTASIAPPIGANINPQMLKVKRNKRRAKDRLISNIQKNICSRRFRSSKLN